MAYYNNGSSLLHPEDVVKITSCVVIQIMPHLLTSMLLLRITIIFKSNNVSKRRNTMVNNMKNTISIIQHDTKITEKLMNKILIYICYSSNKISGAIKTVRVV